jgi:hypothetical protein
MKRKVLVASPVPTHPPTAGNRSSMLNYCKFIEEAGYDVYFLFVSEGRVAERESIELMKEYWKDKLLVFYPKYKSYRLKKRFFVSYRNMIKKGSYHIDDWYPYGLSQWIKKIQQDYQFDVFWVNYIWLSKMLTAITCKRKILDTHDVFSYKFEKTGFMWFSTNANEEAKALDRADKIVAVQDNEGIFFQQLTTKQVVVTFRPFPFKMTEMYQSKNILFFSGGNRHNIDGITWFIQNVYTQLRNDVPGVNLLIGGGICESIKHLEVAGIQLLGEFNNMEQFYTYGNITINPVYQGTGLKVKTFEALSLCKVLVAHPHNIIGVPYPAEIPVFIAETAEEYITHISNLLNNDDLVSTTKNNVFEYMIKYNELVKQRMGILLK